MTVDFTSMKAPLKPKEPSRSPPPSLRMRAHKLKGEFNRKYADGFTVAADDSLVAIGAG